MKNNILKNLSLLTVALLFLGTTGCKKARSRTCQSHHDSHSAVERLQGSLRQSERQRPRLNGFYYRRTIGSGFDRELSRCEYAGDFCAEGKAIERLGFEARHRL